MSDETARAAWLRKCEQQRKIAQTALCTHPKLAYLPCYRWQQVSFENQHKLWSFCLVLETFTRPYQWHVSISVIADIPSTENEFGLPEQGSPFTEHWSDDDRKEAREMISEVLGSLLRHSDDSQIVMVQQGLSALHFMVAYEGPCQPTAPQF